jgi:microcompartment protein CcmK/EutM
MVEAHVDPATEGTDAGARRQSQIELKDLFDGLHALLVERVDRDGTAALAAQCAARQFFAGGRDLALNDSGESSARAVDQAQLDSARALAHKFDLRLGNDDSGSQRAQVEHVT